MKILNDFFITRDVIGYLQNYIRLKKLNLPVFEQKLLDISLKQNMSYEQWWTLLDEFQKQHAIPALGIEIGKEVNVGDCGVLGYLFRTSRNLGEALNCFNRFQGLIYAGSQAHLEQQRQGSISLVWNPDFGYSSQISDELLVAAMINITREIIAPSPLSLSKVSFTQPINSTDLAIYEQYFKCVVLSNQKKLSISFNSNDLLIPIPHEDKTLNSLLGIQAEALLKQLPQSDIFLAELRDTIIRCLHEGNADVKNVAKQFNMSTRTLHRRLKDKNRVYREIVKDIRKSMALTYLGDPKLTLSEIALMLGYSEQSTFTRAFASWYGMAPLRYRRANC